MLAKVRLKNHESLLEKNGIVAWAMVVGVERRAKNLLRSSL